MYVTYISFQQWYKECVVRSCLTLKSFERFHGNDYMWLLPKGTFQLNLAQFKTVLPLQHFSYWSPPFSFFPFISLGHFPWLRWDSFDAVCTPKPRCLFCPESACLGKYFSPNLQNGICVAMDWRQGPGRVNINNQSCRPWLFGLASHSGSSEWGGTCRSRAEWRANNGKHWPPSSELAPGTQSSVR